MGNYKNDNQKDFVQLDCLPWFIIKLTKDFIDWEATGLNLDMF